MKEFTWFVTYGPFSETVIKLNAERLGWRQVEGDVGVDGTLPGSEAITMIDFLTGKLKAAQVAQLSAAAIEAATASILAQAEAVKEQISGDVNNLVTFEVESNDRQA
jgi:hypothetical protein